MQSGYLQSRDAMLRLGVSQAALPLTKELREREAFEKPPAAPAKARPIQEPAENSETASLE
jgi:hypothetical protein